MCIVHRGANNTVVTAATNKAVDNLLKQLKEYTDMLEDQTHKYHPSCADVQCFGRTGRLEDMDETVQSHSVLTWMRERNYGTKKLRRNMQTVLEENFMINVGTLTSFSQSSMDNAPTLLKATRPYDLILIEEAAQATEAAAFGPMFLGRNGGSFVMIGDHCQLAPYVESIAARDRGFNISFFQRMYAFNGIFIFTLQIQYRRLPSFTRMSHRLVYAGKMKDTESTWLRP